MVAEKVRRALALAKRVYGHAHLYNTAQYYSSSRVYIYSQGIRKIYIYIYIKKKVKLAERRLPDVGDAFWLL